jgi:hypothetical protein
MDPSGAGYTVICTGDMKIFKSQLNLRAGADWGTFDFLGYL